VLVQRYRITILILTYLGYAGPKQTAGLMPEGAHLAHFCATETWKVSFVSSLTRITPPVPCLGLTKLQLTAARGEYVSFQILVGAGVSPVDNVDVYSSDFFGPAGLSINRRNVTLYREHAVHVEKGSPDLGGDNRPLGPGWYPDALIPLRETLAGGHTSQRVAAAAPFSIHPATAEIIWADVFVPRDAAPGDYTGTISITGSPGMIDLPVRLSVWRFMLPVKPSLQSSFGLHTPNDRDLTTQLLLLRHKLMPLFVSAEVAGRLSLEEGLNTTGIRLFGRANSRSCTMGPVPNEAVIASMSRLFPVDLPRYVYSADEVGACPGLFEAIRSWGKSIHTADPALKNLVTMAPVPALLDDGTGSGRSAVDIWVALPPDYTSHQAQIDQVLRKGDQVWSYTALVQDSYSPKWEIDFRPINFRILPGFLSQSMRLTGLLYWRVDNWNAAPWNTVPAYTIPSSSNAYPGEGMLVYPGKAVGLSSTLPSMRLKWIRDGVQDYEYICLLKQRGRGEWAMRLSKRVAPDWHQWTKDPIALEAARVELGSELNRLAASDTEDGR